MKKLPVVDAEPGAKRNAQISSRRDAIKLIMESDESFIQLAEMLSDSVPDCGKESILRGAVLFATGGHLDGSDLNCDMSDVSHFADYMCKKDRFTNGT